MSRVSWAASMPASRVSTTRISSGSSAFVGLWNAASVSSEIVRFTPAAFSTSSSTVMRSARWLRLSLAGVVSVRDVARPAASIVISTPVIRSMSAYQG